MRTLHATIEEMDSWCRSGRITCMRGPGQYYDNWTKVLFTHFNVPPNPFLEDETTRWAAMLYECDAPHKVTREQRNSYKLLTLGHQYSANFETRVGFINTKVADDCFKDVSDEWLKCYHEVAKGLSTGIANEPRVHLIFPRTRLKSSWNQKPWSAIDFGKDETCVYPWTAPIKREGANILIVDDVTDPYNLKGTIMNNGCEQIKSAEVIAYESVAAMQREVEARDAKIKELEDAFVRMHEDFDKDMDKLTDELHTMRKNWAKQVEGLTDERHARNVTLGNIIAEWDAVIAEAQIVRNSAMHLLKFGN